MNKFVVALSAVSTGRSSWLILGVSGMAYTMGIGAVWAVAGYILIEMFQFVYIGRKLRKDTEAFKSLTLLDYFESRFGDNKHIIRLTGTIIIAIFITAYVAAQLNAGSIALSTALHIPFLLSLVLSGILIMVYMVLGGFIAVAYNDVIRALIMLLGLVIFPIYGLIKIISFEDLVQTLKHLDVKLINPTALGFGSLIGFLGIGLGSPGQPHVVVRYMSIKNGEHLRFSALIGTIWNVILAWGALFVGLISRAIIPLNHLPNNNPEMVYLQLSSELFGPALYGLLVGGLFAAILSTADSQLLVLASTFVNDLYQKIIHKDKVISDEKQLFLSRTVVILSGILSMILAYLAKDIIFWLVLFAWGGLGASFGTALILSIYWKKTTRSGVVCGMITGTIITIAWKLFLKTTTGVYELIPAFFGAMLVIILVSLWTKSELKRD